MVSAAGADCPEVVLDGKTVKGAKQADGTQVHLLSALLLPLGAVANQEEVDGKTNEIPMARPLLEPLPLEGKTVVADAMHWIQR